MARGKNPGDDFDAQYNANRRKGQDKASRGEGPWYDDKYRSDLNNRLGAGGQPPEQKSCGEKTVVLLAMLSGVIWGVSEAVSRIA